jgi:hypothetical protein
VLDYLADPPAWATWSISNGVHAAIWQGVHYYLRAPGRAEQTRAGRARRRLRTHLICRPGRGQRAGREAARGVASARNCQIRCQRQALHMRQAILVLVMVLVGCTDLSGPDGPDGGVLGAVPTHGQDNCPGGGGGGGGGSGGGGEAADPHPIPAPRDCTEEASRELCLDCCDWNVEKVWGERCRRLPNKTKKDRNERRRCWEDAERRRRDCQLGCPIVTVAP